MRVLTGILFITMALSAPALTHEGHDHKTMGTVSALHGRHLEVAGTDRKTHTFALGDKTKVMRGKTIVQASDIRVGERIVVIYTQAKDKATGKTATAVKEVRLPAAAASRGALYW